MLAIKVLGPGCANCDRLFQLTEQAVEEIKKEHPAYEATVEKVTDPEAFLNYGLLKTPGLVLNERLVISGHVPAMTQIVAVLREALEVDE
ncbi:MAG: thioredoxin family protein [Anaerolineaceae bacterium]|nr:MAG: thioredoxin family protein [Anaerolineaceae bacterium]